MPGLGDRRAVTVVTNNLRLPAEVPPDAGWDVYVLGGSLRLSSMATIGPIGFPGTGESAPASRNFVHICDLTAVSALVTEREADLKPRNAVKDAHVEVVYSAAE